MNDSLNILILSCGTRNKIVQYFKQELGNRGQVIVTDCNELAPALYEADKYYIVPNMKDISYLNTIINICKDNNIKAVLSLIDPELSLLAENRDAFLEVGTIPIISDFNLVETCFDKYKFYELLTEQGFRTIKSYIDKDIFFKDLNEGLINYPVFVKPIRGSASTNINKVSNNEEIELLFSRYDNLMIQEFMDGVEYGADIYIDMISGELITAFTKEKIKMRAGETDKSVSIKDKELFELISRFIKVTNFKGIIDIDIFKVDGEFYISEVNPRFGGGYPHAYECGVNIPKMIINNLDSIANEYAIGEYDEQVYMMKFNEVKIIRK